MISRVVSIGVACWLVAAVAVAGQTGAHIQDISEAAWADSLDGYKGRVAVSGLEGVESVVVSYRYPAGNETKIAAKADASKPGEYTFKIPGDVLSSMGELSYTVSVAHAGESPVELKRVVPLGYGEDLEITANPPEILWFPLGDKSETVRYKACCNILGASIIAKRIPVNPKASSEGLPEKLYSDFIWLEPDALSASTAGLFFEWRFKPEDFADTESKAPVLYEYDWREENWTRTLTFEITENHVIDFPCTEGGLFVLGWE